MVELYWRLQCMICHIICSNLQKKKLSLAYCCNALQKTSVHTNKSTASLIQYHHLCCFLGKFAPVPADQGNSAEQFTLPKERQDAPALEGAVDLTRMTVDR